MFDSKIWKTPRRDLRGPGAWHVWPRPGLGPVAPRMVEKWLNPLHLIITCDPILIIRQIGFHYWRSEFLNRLSFFLLYFELVLLVNVYMDFYYGRLMLMSIWFSIVFRVNHKPPQKCLIVRFEKHRGGIFGGLGHGMPGPDQGWGQ